MHLLGFTKKYITMHGHTNVMFSSILFCGISIVFECLVFWPRLFCICVWVHIVIPITRLTIQSRLVWYTGPLHLFASRNAVRDIPVSSSECLAPLDYDARYLTQKTCLISAVLRFIWLLKEAFAFRRISPRPDGDRIIFIYGFSKSCIVLLPIAEAQPSSGTL